MADRLGRLLRPTLAPVWFLVPLVGIVVAATLEPIPPHDYWWPLVMGRWIAETGQIPSTNTFVYTMPGDAEFLNQPWLAQWIMFRVHEAFGHGGLVVLRNVLLILAWAIALATMRARVANPMAVGATALVFMMVTVPVLTVRTRMFAFVPFAVLMWGIWSAYENPRHAWRLFVSVPFVAFWTNVHGTFILAPVLMAAATGAVWVERVVGHAARSTKELLVWTGATLVVALSVGLNPLGLEIYRYVLLLSVTSNVSTTVSEWRPPNLAEPIGQFFLGLVVVGTGLLAWQRRQVRIHEALMWAAGVVLAASAVRSLFWFSMAGALVLVPVIARWASASAPDGRPLNAALVAILVVVGVGIQPGLAHHAMVEASTLGLAKRDGDGRHLLGYENATSALDQIKRRWPDARIFHDQALGGLVEWTFATTQRPAVAFVDQRMELMTDTVWADYFEVISGPEWRAVLERWQINVVVVRPDEQWTLVQRLELDPRWSAVFADDAHLVFVERSLLDR